MGERRGEERGGGGKGAFIPPRPDPKSHDPYAPLRRPRLFRGEARRGLQFDKYNVFSLSFFVASYLRPFYFLLPPNRVWVGRSVGRIALQYRSYSSRSLSPSLRPPGARFNGKNNPTRNPSRSPTSFPSKFHVLENHKNWVVETCLRVKLLSRWKTRWISRWIIFSIESGPWILDTVEY